MVFMTALVDPRPEQVHKIWYLKVDFSLRLDDYKLPLQCSAVQMLAMLQGERTK